MTATEHMRPDGIFEVLMGFMASKHLFVANEVGLFGALAEGSATLEHLAERIGVPQRTLRIIADATVALGFVEREDGAYRNGAAADAFLSGRGAVNLSPALRFMNAIAYPVWEGLERAVRTDGSARGELTEEQQKGSSLRASRLSRQDRRTLSPPITTSVATAGCSTSPAVPARSW